MQNYDETNRMYVEYRSVAKYNQKEMIFLPISLCFSDENITNIYMMIQYVSADFLKGEPIIVPVAKKLKHAYVINNMQQVMQILEIENQIKVLT